MNPHWIDGKAIANVTMPEAIRAVRRAFIGYARGEFEVPQRVSLHSGAFLIMTCLHKPTQSSVVKHLSLDFTRKPAIRGTVTWDRLGDTTPAIFDASAITGLRTGAVTGVATDLLAPPSADTCTLIGAGKQGEYQIWGVHAVRPLRHLTIVDRHIDRARAMADRVRTRTGGAIDIQTTTDISAAIAGRDVICCATTATEPLFDSEKVGPRTHFNAIGAYRADMSELPPRLLGKSFVVVDDIVSVLAESGEVIDAIRLGDLDKSDLNELGYTLLNPPHDGRLSGPTVFKSVGLAIQDWAIASMIADQTQ